MSQSHYKSNMSDIKALLTEMGTKEESDAGSQKDYHDSHSSSGKT